VANTIVMPLVESRDAIEGLEGIFAMKRPRCSWHGRHLATGRRSRNVEHPGVWEIIDRAAALAVNTMSSSP